MSDEVNESKKKRAGTKSDEEDDEDDIENLIDFEAGLKDALYGVEQSFKPRIFRHTALRNFMSKTLAQMNPDLSLSNKAIEYYAEVFTRFLFEKVCFEYWGVKNNH